MSKRLTPEIYEALKVTARAVEFRLEDEYHTFDWEERLENAALMREIAAHEPRGVATIEPTLEDVYLRLMSDRGMRV